MHTDLENWQPAVAVISRPWAVETPMPRIRFLRVMTLAMIASLVVMGVVLLVLVDPGGVETGWLYGWAGFSALTLPIGYYVRARRNEHFVRTATERDAYGFYRTRVVAGLAIAELPALIGFGFSIPADSLLPYLAGLAVSMIRFAQHGPTGADVAQLQGWLDEYQDPFDLAALLMQPAQSPE